MFLNWDQREISGLLSNNLIYAVHFLTVFGNKTCCLSVCGVCFPSIKMALVHVAVAFSVSVLILCRNGKIFHLYLALFEEIWPSAAPRFEVKVKREVI